MSDDAVVPLSPPLTAVVFGWAAAVLVVVVRGWAGAGVEVVLGCAALVVVAGSARDDEVAGAALVVAFSMLAVLVGTVLDGKEEEELVFTLHREARRFRARTRGEGECSSLSMRFRCGAE